MSKMIPARVLCGFSANDQEYKPDDYAEFPADQAAQLKASGLIDDHKDAVDHVKNVLKSPLKKHAV
jgi:hypothetical protein